MGMSYEEARARMIELHNAMVTVERLGGASPEQTAVIVALGERMRELKEIHNRAAAQAMLSVLYLNPDRVTSRDTVRDLEGFAGIETADNETADNETDGEVQ